MIKISINNTPEELTKNTPLSHAIIQWGFGEKKIAVAINGEFVPRSTYGEREIQAGDEIDIVQPVGGG